MGYRVRTMNVIVSSAGKLLKTGVFAASSYAEGGGKATYRTPEELSAAIKDAMDRRVNVAVAAPRGASYDIFLREVVKDFPQARYNHKGGLKEVYIRSTPPPRIIPPRTVHGESPPVVVSGRGPGLGYRVSKFFQGIAEAYRTSMGAYRKKRRPARA